MKPATGFLQLALIQRAASTSALPPISPIMTMPTRLGVVIEHPDDVEVRGAVDRVAADADAGALADRRAP